MAKQIVNVGTSADDNTGDVLRTSFQKINSNANELYDSGGAVIIVDNPATNAPSLLNDALNDVFTAGGGGVPTLQQVYDVNGGGIVTNNDVALLITDSVFPDIQTVIYNDTYAVRNTTGNQEYTQIGPNVVAFGTGVNNGANIEAQPQTGIGIMQIPDLSGATEQIASRQWVQANPTSVNADSVTETATRVFVTPAEKTAITHANRSILDAISESFTTALKTAYDGVVTGYNALMLTGSRLITNAEITKLSNTIGTNTGDQTSIVGITGTKTQFNTSVTDGDVMFVGDAPTAHTHAIADVTNLQTSLNAKENTITAGTTAQYYRGDKTFQTLDKTSVGLANVDNTSDANKPISTATQTALNGKANTSHTHVASDVTDFNSASRAQTEAELVAGSGVTITPSGTGATRQLTIASTGGGGGEANTASNVNATGVGVFKQKTGVNLEFKGINSTNNKLTITDDTANNEIDITVNEGNLVIPQASVTNLTTDLAGKMDLTTPQTKNVGVTANTTPLLVTGSINDFLQHDIKNTSTAANAQSGYSATSDVGTPTANFMWMGKNNSGFNNPQTYNVGGASDGSMLNDGGNLWIHNTGTTGKVAISTGNASTPFFTERVTILNSNGNVGIGDNTPTSALTIKSGTATIAPLELTPTGAVLLTTPISGAVEVDANGLQYYTGASGRGLSIATRMLTLATAYTTPIGTANVLKALFNVPTSGAFTSPATTAYKFRCSFNLTAISATAGTVAFGFGGTATYTNVTMFMNYQRVANTNNATALLGCHVSTATPGTAGVANQLSTTSGTATSGMFIIEGIIRVNGAGTIIPSIAQSIATASVVGAGAIFEITPIGINTVTNVGSALT